MAKRVIITIIAKIIAIILICGSFFAPTSVSAASKVCKCTITYTDGTTEETDGVKVAILGDENGCSCSDKNGSGITHILLFVIDFMTIGIGILAVIGISIVGILYLTAHGDVSQTTKAKTRLSEIILGIIVYTLLWTLLEWLLPGGKINVATSDIASVSSRLEDPPVTQTSSEESATNDNAANTDGADDKSSETSYTNPLASGTYTNSKNGITFNLYHQEDEPWGSLPVNGNTVGKSGCNLIAAAVVVSGADPTITPKEAYEAKGGNGWTEHYVEAISSAKATFSCQASASYTWDKLTADLAAGKVVTAQTRRGGDHYVSFIDINANGDQVYIGNSAGNGTWGAIFETGWTNLSAINNRALLHTTVCSVNSR